MRIWWTGIFRNNNDVFWTIGTLSLWDWNYEDMRIWTVFIHELLFELALNFRRSPIYKQVWDLINILFSKSLLPLFAPIVVFDTYDLIVTAISSQSLIYLQDNSGFLQQQLSYKTDKPW